MVGAGECWTKCQHGGQRDARVVLLRRHPFVFRQGWRRLHQLARKYFLCEVASCRSRHCGRWTKRAKARFSVAPSDGPVAPAAMRKHLLGGREEAGLEQLLEMLRRDPVFDNGLPKRALIDAFRIIEDAELVGRYRRRMASLLLV
ncbi:MAG TPA: tetratricopeptide repeat protein [Xanthomonadaceae bacterium]|nr:tetratricopeptide repeat protein [Xanthomonadaceae bacterium]